MKLSWKYLLLSLVASSCRGQQCNTSTVHTMVPIPAQNNRLFDINFILWNRAGVRTLLSCVSDCFRDNRCQSVTFNLRTGICISYSVKYNSAKDLPKPSPGFIYYELSISGTGCDEILAANPTSRDGVYVIDPEDGEGAVSVYCDMTTDGGGWTTFQRRMDGSISFFLDWETYKIGFGKLAGEFWLGNEIISRLTRIRKAELRIDLKDSDGLVRYEKYASFLVGTAATDFKLRLTGYTSGNVADSFANNHNGKPFTTFDHSSSLQMCKSKSNSGWWYSIFPLCQGSNLNGLYGEPKSIRKTTWLSWAGTVPNMTWTEMKLRNYG